MAPTQVAKHPVEGFELISRKAGGCADRAAERMILLTIATAAGAEAALLVWLIL